MAIQSTSVGQNADVTRCVHIYNHVHIFFCKLSIKYSRQTISFGGGAGDVYNWGIKSYLHLKVCQLLFRFLS